MMKLAQFFSWSVIPLLVRVETGLGGRIDKTPKVEVRYV